MIHYSCDRCKRMIDPARETRHVVKIETQTVIEAPLEDGNEDRDYLQEIDEMLECLDLDDDPGCVDQECTAACFDLCADCYRKFLRDPLGAEVALPVSFSHN
jgi:hypothetical protein